MFPIGADHHGLKGQGSVLMESGTLAHIADLPRLLQWLRMAVGAEVEEMGTYIMIELTRFDGTRFYVNADYIEFIESTPDTVVTLIDRNKLRVRESAIAIIDRILALRQRLAQAPASARALLRWNQGREGYGRADLDADDGTGRSAAGVRPEES